jgi:hypothetical protein
LREKVEAWDTKKRVGQAGPARKPFQRVGPMQVGPSVLGGVSAEKRGVWVCVSALCTSGDTGTRINPLLMRDKFQATICTGCVSITSTTITTTASTSTISHDRLSLMPVVIIT